jgi:hypothetical protein
LKTLRISRRSTIASPELQALIVLAGKRIKELEAQEDRLIAETIPPELNDLG